MIDDYERCRRNRRADERMPAKYAWVTSIAGPWRQGRGGRKRRSRTARRACPRRRAAHAKARSNGTWLSRRGSGTCCDGLLRKIGRRGLGIIAVSKSGRDDASQLWETTMDRQQSGC